MWLIERLRECGECSARLGLDLIRSGHGNLAFVGIELSSAEYGMEKVHSLIIANLLNLNRPSDSSSLTIYDLFDILPNKALVCDPFLGLVFQPNNIPVEFVNYIDAYAGKTKIIQCTHFYNVPKDSKMFGGYFTVAEKVAAELKLKHPLLPEDLYSLEDKTRIEDSTLIMLLKEKSELPFFGVWDKTYKVDAVAEINSEKSKELAVRLHHQLNSHGRFFTLAENKEIFVLEGVNLGDDSPMLINNIRHL